MTYLAQDERTLFLGQNVDYPGNGLFNTLENVPLMQRLELPVAEDMQMGISTGLSLNGIIPISIFPRMDFLILAMNQLVNHLDKISRISCNQFEPKVIIRTAVGSMEPFYPGLQHCSDYSNELFDILECINVVILTDTDAIFNSYKRALESNRSTLLIEYCDLY